ncbi:MAG: DNA-3-methyladenine glycosylase [Myxococcales bacterium]|nr:DNA-3-methyladenine glycosylase [Myxococcales bacterium]
MARLPRSFFARDVLEVAPDLLGRELVRGAVRLRITEVEAYGPRDTACHAHRGRTPRNAVMFGPPGHAYVYLCYGLHWMLNVVTNAPGEPAAVLIRACEPVEGLTVVRERRGGKSGPVLLTGPGKVGAALGLDGAMSGHALYRRGQLELHAGAPIQPSEMVVGPRVGIDYAAPADREAHHRFAIGTSAWVSHRKGLAPRTAASR